MKSMLELFDKTKSKSVERVRTVYVDDEDSSESDYNESYEQEFVSKEMHKYHEAVKEVDDDYDGYLSDVDNISTDTNSISNNHFTDLYSKYNFKLLADNNAKLPINSFKDQIILRIMTNQVTVIEGPTGCGKTTQVPQMILDNCRERNEYCHIIVTQPRRIAAINIAKRVCQERGWSLGTVCGYQVGLEKMVEPDQIITYVTTGVLLQKLIQTKSLDEYTHIIIDEVHERNQDLDFLLLVVRKYLFTKSQNTKVILMSATIIADDFAFYFKNMILNQPVSAPIIKVDQVSPYKTSIFYLDDVWQDSMSMPAFNSEEPQIFREIWSIFLFLIEIFDKLDQNGEVKGSVLVFLPGLYEIEEAHKMLISRKKIVRNAVNWEIIPLHSLLPGDEQARVFTTASKGTRKIILSTNIAESSITVANTSYVIDFCQTKVMTLVSYTNYSCLKLEWASHVNCDQRAGRVGRTCNGRVYRLVTRKFYNEHMTKMGIPEMLRAPLSQTVLQAKMLELEETPSQILALAMSPPNLSRIKTTVLQLKQIGALLNTCRGTDVKHDGDLTFLGRVMAALPIDVHLTKMIVLGQLFSCIEEAIIIAAGCSIQNIFSIPFKKRLEEYRKRLLWADNSNSDLIVLLNLYTVWQNLKSEGAFNNNRKELEWCQRNLVNLKALKEWHLLVMEIKKRLGKMNVKEVDGPGKILLSDIEKPTLLKVVIAGAFYPNFFLKSPRTEFVSESDAVREVGGRDPFSTVYFKGMDASQPAQIYGRQIKEIIQKNCERQVNMSIGFDSNTKLYVEFKDISGGDFVSLLNGGALRLINMPGKIPNVMYELVRQRQLKYNYKLKVLDHDSAWKFAEKHGIEKPSSFVFNSSTNKPNRNCFSDVSYNPIPGPDIQIVQVHICNFVDASHYWVQNDDVIINRLLYQIEKSLNKQKLKKLEEPPKFGNIYVTRYKEDGLYYRCKILSIYDNVSQIIFIDYGNVDEVETGNLYHLPKLPQCSVSPLAYECVLVGVKPSIRYNPTGTWSDSVNAEVGRLINNVLLYAQVYSVVNGLVEVEIYRNKQRNLSLNQYLLDKGFAVPCKPSFLSNQNHEYREEMMVTNSRKVDIGVTDLGCSDLSPNINEMNSRYIALRGPYSPLETNYVSCTMSTINKEVKIISGSVNVVLFDTEPDANFSRLLVAAHVSQSSETGNLLLNQTTLMPNIPGFPMLLAMIFCPTMEPKITRDNTLVAALLCGLGYNKTTMKPLYPSNDIFLSLDTELTMEEVEKVNKLRYLMNNGIEIMAEFEYDQFVGDTLIKIQNSIKDQLFCLINMERSLIDRSDVIAEEETWGEFNGLDVLCSNLHSDEQDIWGLLSFVKLIQINSQQRAIIKNLEDIDNMLYEVSSFDTIKCLLCEEEVYFIHALRLHVISDDHQKKLAKFKIMKE